jgi:DNA-binding HxlR family transcriptional regulator
MKSYGQFCSVAKSLDVIGDRWTLLILRELLLQGPCRYTDLANGLPGIASNLLSDRMRSLEEAGLVRREAAPPPVAATLFHLTERGRATEPILAAMARWGAEFVEGTPTADEQFRSYWFPYSVSSFLRDRAPGTPPVTVQLVTPIGSWAVTASDRGTSVHDGVAPDPDLMVDGHPRLILGLLSGSQSLDRVRAEGLTVTGDPSVLASFPLVPV